MCYWAVFRVLSWSKISLNLWIQAATPENGNGVKYYLRALCPWPNAGRQVASKVWDVRYLSMLMQMKMPVLCSANPQPFCTHAAWNKPESSRVWYRTNQTEGEHKSKKTASSCVVCLGASVTVFDTAGRTALRWLCCWHISEHNIACNWHSSSNSIQYVFFDKRAIVCPWWFKKQKTFLNRHTLVCEVLVLLNRGSCFSIH